MTIHPLLTMALALAAAAAGAMAQDDRSGFYIVSGFSLGEDAVICEARIQGTGAVYVPGHKPALELSVRQKPSAAAPVVAYLRTVERADGGLHGIHAADEPNLIVTLPVAAPGGCASSATFKIIVRAPYFANHTRGSDGSRLV